MVKLFRRHSTECKKDLAAKKISLPKQREYKACDCGIWFSGRRAGVTYKRTALGVTNWHDAERVLEDRLNPRPQATEPQARAVGVSLAAAMAHWDRASKLAGLGAATMARHARVVGQLQAVAEGMQAPLLADVGDEVIAELRMRWMAAKLADSTHFLYLACLAAFFKHAIDQTWITDSPLPPVKQWPPHMTVDRDETRPLDPDGGDGNYQRILADLNGPRVWRSAGRGGRPQAYVTGPTLAAMAELMYESGLRISDAVMFRPGKLILDAEVAEYTYLPVKTARTRKLCTTFMPLWLAHKLRALPDLTPGYPFYDGKDYEDTATPARRELSRIGRQCGIPDVHPHRFRDSFAVNALNAGTPIEVVSKMLGHSNVAVTEKYYAPWVRSRRDHLRREYLKLHAPVPANVVPISRLG